MTLILFEMLLPNNGLPLVGNTIEIFRDIENSMNHGRGIDISHCYSHLQAT